MTYLQISFQLRIPLKNKTKRQFGNVLDIYKDNKIVYSEYGTHTKLKAP